MSKVLQRANLLSQLHQESVQDFIDKYDNKEFAPPDNRTRFQKELDKLLNYKWAAALALVLVVGAFIINKGQPIVSGIRQLIGGSGTEEATGPVEMGKKALVVVTEFGGEEKFSNVLINHLKKHNTSAEIGVDGIDSYIFHPRNIVLARKKDSVMNLYKNFRGIVTYGDYDLDRQVINCYADVSRVHRKYEFSTEGAEIVITPPQTISFHPTEHGEYIAQFLLGILYTFEGDYEKAIEVLDASWDPKGNNPSQSYFHTLILSCEPRSA